MSMHHPWRTFRRLADWALSWEILPPGVMGVTDWDSRTVTLDRRLRQAERRCTIAHETQHIMRGPGLDDPVLMAREESAADKAAARALIDLHDLGEALAWSDHLAVVADELWVDPALLRVRLDHLHPSELAYLRRRLGDK